MDSVDLIVTEVNRLKDVIACLKGENAALKEELAQHRITQVKTPALPTLKEEIVAIATSIENGEKGFGSITKGAIAYRLRQLLLT